MDALPPPYQAAILSIGTAVPGHQIEQRFVERWMYESFGQQPAEASLLHRIYRNSGIETRYTCLPDGDFPPQESRFGPGQNLADVATTADTCVNTPLKASSRVLPWRLGQG